MATQEQIIRQILQGFVNDPPDTDYQSGFLACAVVVANEVMGIAWDDTLLLAATKLHADMDLPKKEAFEAITKRAKLSAIDGGKPTNN